MFGGPSPPLPQAWAFGRAELRATPNERPPMPCEAKARRARRSTKNKTAPNFFGAVCNYLLTSGKQSYRFSTTRGVGLIISS